MSSHSSLSEWFESLHHDVRPLKEIYRALLALNIQLRDCPAPFIQNYYVVPGLVSDRRKWVGYALYEGIESILSAKEKSEGRSSSSILLRQTQAWFDLAVTDVLNPSRSLSSLDDTFDSLVAWELGVRSKVEKIQTMEAAAGYPVTLCLEDWNRDYAHFKKYLFSQWLSLHTSDEEMGMVAEYFKDPASKDYPEDGFFSDDASFVQPHDVGPLPAGILVKLKGLFSDSEKHLRMITDQENLEIFTQALPREPKTFSDWRRVNEELQKARGSISNWSLVVNYMTDRLVKAPVIPPTCVLAWEDPCPKLIEHAYFSVLKFMINLSSCSAPILFWNAALTLLDWALFEKKPGDAERMAAITKALVGREAISTEDLRLWDEMHDDIGNILGRDNPEFKFLIDTAGPMFKWTSGEVKDLEIFFSTLTKFKHFFLAFNSSSIDPGSNRFRPMKLKAWWNRLSPQGKEALSVTSRRSSLGESMEAFFTSAEPLGVSGSIVDRCFRYFVEQDFIRLQMFRDRVCRAIHRIPSGWHAESRNFRDLLSQARTFEEFFSLLARYLALPSPSFTPPLNRGELHGYRSGMLREICKVLLQYAHIESRDIYIDARFIQEMIVGLNDRISISHHAHFSQVFFRPDIEQHFSDEKGFESLLRLLYSKANTTCSADHVPIDIEIPPKELYHLAIATSQYGELMIFMMLVDQRFGEKIFLEQIEILKKVMQERLNPRLFLENKMPLAGAGAGAGAGGSSIAVVTEIHPLMLIKQERLSTSSLSYCGLSWMVKYPTGPASFAEFLGRYVSASDTKTWGEACDQVLEQFAQFEKKKPYEFPQFSKWFDSDTTFTPRLFTGVHSGACLTEEQGYTLTQFVLGLHNYLLAQDICSGMGPRGFLPGAGAYGRGAEVELTRIGGHQTVSVFAPGAPGGAGAGAGAGPRATNEI